MIGAHHIGLETAARSVRVDAVPLRTFAAAIGETDPIYLDHAAAQAAGHPAVLAPPTFAFCLYSTAPGEGGMATIMACLGIDPAKVLHGQQRFDYVAPIYCGDVITVRERVTDIYAKKHGALEFVEISAEAFNQDGLLCVRQRILLAVRHTRP